MAFWSVRRKGKFEARVGIELGAFSKREGVAEGGDWEPAAEIPSGVEGPRS